jgi:hypothetical protein
MKRVPMAARLACALLFAIGRATAQTMPLPAEPWTYRASASLYFIEDEEDYVQPTVAADRGNLHLEARFNYEDRDSGSAWAGYNLAVGDELVLEVTPMLGVVFGDTRGIAPGYEASLSWRSLEFYSESEYVFDAGDSRDSFLYTWTELTLAPADWWRVGLVAQRTKVYETDFDIQRGFLVGFSREHLDVTAYVFNPDESPAFVLAVGASF